MSDLPLKLLEQKFEEARHTAGLGMTSFNMFVTVQAALVTLLGLLFGAKSTVPDFKIPDSFDEYVAAAAIAISLVYGIACSMLMRLSQVFDREIKHLSSEFSDLLVEPQAQPLSRVATIGLIFAAVVALAWSSFVFLSPEPASLANAAP